MKKIIFLFTIAIIFVSCNKSSNEVKKFNTAYIDTSELMEQSLESKDIETKYKDKSKKMGDDLQKEIENFKNEASNFQKNAEVNGQVWAQKKGAELQEKEQRLTYAQQAILQQLQEESGKEMDSLIKKYKKIIKDFGKEKGYDYIFGTGEPASILYAKDAYDITKEVAKIINDKYKSGDKKEKK